MGTFYVSCEVANHVARRRRARVPKLLVDTGSDYTWIPEAVLKRIGVAEGQKDVSFLKCSSRRHADSKRLKCSSRRHADSKRRAQERKWGLSFVRPSGRTVT